jgi:peptide-methionine (S)-S-oxide reductase
MLRGVSKVEPGYAGPVRNSPPKPLGRASAGEISNGAGGFTVENPPTYEQVSTGKTGLAEVIQVTYDPAIISYDDLLTVFFGSHDPTTPNRQGADVGEQYRSVILYGSDEEKRLAEAKVKEINESLKDGTRVVTQVVPLGSFFPAESYHQNYYKTNTSAPYCQLVIEPKLEKVKKRFAELVKQ